MSMLNSKKFKILFKKYNFFEKKLVFFEKKFENEKTVYIFAPAIEKIGFLVFKKHTST